MHLFLKCDHFPPKKMAAAPADLPLDVALHLWQSALFEADAPGGATRALGAFKLLHELESRLADG